MALEPFGVDEDREVILPERRIPTRELEARQAIGNEATTGETLAANMRQAFAPVVAFNALKNAFAEPEVGFSLDSDQAKEYTAGLDTNEMTAILDVKSMTELRGKTAAMRQEKKDDNTLSQQGIVGGIATGAVMMLGDPFAMGAMGVTSRVLRGLGTTAYRRVGINALAVGAEVGTVEAVYRSTAAENYESVAVTAGMGMVFGAGLSSLGEWIGRSASGNKERMARDFERLAMDDDNPTNPGMGSLREFYEDSVAVPTRETRSAPEFAGETSFGQQGQLFNLETKWSTPGIEHPRFQVKPQAKDSKITTNKNNLRDSVLHYVKPPANMKKPTKLYKAAKTIANRIAKRTAEMSHTRYDTSDIVGEIIDDSMKTGNRSNATKYERSDNGGLSKGERWTANTIPDNIFVTEQQAKRIASGRATENDLKALEKAVDGRLGEYETAAGRHEEWMQNGTGPQVKYNEDIDVIPDRGPQVAQPDYVDMQPMWRAAPDSKQPAKEWTIRDNFEAMYDRTIADEQAFGRGIDEARLSKTEKDMIKDAGETAKNVAIERSVASAWLGKIGGSRLTGSTMNILLGKAADGTIDKRVAVLLSKFDTLIYRLKGADGEPLEAKTTTADIKEELNQVFGLNNAYKYEAWSRYKQWWSQQDDDIGEMLSEEGYDQRVTQMYMDVYSEFEGRVADNMMNLRKDPEVFVRVSNEVDARLNATKQVEVEGTDEMTGKKVTSTEEILADDRFAAAREEGDEVAAAYRDAEIELELKKLAEKDVDPVEIMKENPNIKDFDRTAMEAEIEFYRYYSRRAKINGLDSKGTWSDKMYHRQSINKEKIVDAADRQRVHNLFSEGIRRHRTYQNTVKEAANRARGRLQNADGVPKSPLAKRMAQEVEDLMIDMAELGPVRDEGTYSAMNATLTRNLAWFAKKAKSEAMTELQSEIRYTMNVPSALAGKILDGAETAVNLKDSSFDIKFGGPGFLKQRTLALDISVPGLDEFLNVGSQRNLQAYDYQIRGQMAAKEVFGTTDKDVFLAEQSLAVPMDDKTKNMLGDMFDIVLGDKQIPADPNAWSERIAMAANKFTFLTSGGGFFKYAVSELGVISAKHGFANTFREIPDAMRVMKDLYRDMQTGRVDFSNPEVRDLFAFGEVFELYSRRMKSAFSDMSAADALMDSQSRTGPLHKTNEVLGKGQQEFYKWTGLEAATMVTKMVAARAFMRRLGDVVVEGKVQDVDLGRWGFNQEDLVKLRGELEGVGYTRTGLSDFQFDQWQDKAFASKMRRVITRASRDTVLRNEDLRKPTWMVDGETYPIFKTTKLFMSFQLMSQERLLTAGFSDSPAKVGAGMLATAGLLGMAYAIGEMTAVMSGAKKEEDAVLPWGENAPKFYRQLAVMNSYSGNWGMAGQAFGFRNWDGGIAQGKFGASYRDVSMFFGGAPVSKLFSTLDGVGGEGFNYATGEEASGKRFFNGLKGAIPGNNHWMFDSVFKGMGYKAFTDDED